MKFIYLFCFDIYSVASKQDGKSFLNFCGLFRKPATKGQLISKGHLGVLNSSKNEQKNFNFCPSLLGKKFLVCFFEELKAPKRKEFCESVFFGHCADLTAWSLVPNSAASHKTSF